MFGNGGGIALNGDGSKSLRFRSGAYMTRTPGTAGDRLKWTFSVWVKQGNPISYNTIFAAGVKDSLDYNDPYTFIDIGGQISFEAGNNAGSLGRAVASAVISDKTNFYHLVCVYDSANGTANDRMIIYINGSRASLFSNIPPAASLQGGVNSTYQHQIGCRLYYDAETAPSTAIVGYADCVTNKICFVEGSALAPTSFGYQDPISNVWTSKSPAQVKSVVNAGGARSFMLGFETGTSATTLCNDNSSKGNHWTPAGTSFSTTTDWLSDIPGNSFATLNPHYPSASTLSNANLTASGTTDQPTLNPTHGSWYFEIGGVSKTWTPPAAFPSAAGDYNFGARAFTNSVTAGHRTLCQANMRDFEPITTSGSFTGNASTNGPCVDIGGTPGSLTINGNAVTWGTHAYKTSYGFKVISSAATYNAAGTNTFVVTSPGATRRFSIAQTW